MQLSNMPRDQLARKITFSYSALSKISHFNGTPKAKNNSHYISGPYPGSLSMAIFFYQALQ